jgi:hypothetical protein
MGQRLTRRRSCDPRLVELANTTRQQLVDEGEQSESLRVAASSSCRPRSTVGRLLLSARWGSYGTPG